MEDIFFSSLQLEACKTLTLCTPVIVCYADFIKLITGHFIFRLELSNLCHNVTIMKNSFNIQVPSICLWVFIYQNVCEGNIYKMYISHEKVRICFTAAYKIEQNTKTSCFLNLKLKKTLEFQFSRIVNCHTEKENLEGKDIMHRQSIIFLYNPANVARDQPILTKAQYILTQLIY